MAKRLSLVAIFASFILACVVSVPPATTPAPAIVPTVSPSPAPVCAVVTAETAVHLRTRPEASAPSLAHLLHGQRVIVLEGNGDWWLVSSGKMQGYVRASWLEICR